MFIRSVVFIDTESFRKIFLDTFATIGQLFGHKFSILNSLFNSKLSNGVVESFLSLLFKQLEFDVIVGENLHGRKF